MQQLIAAVPPWLALSIVLGSLLGAVYKAAFPRSRPGILAACALLAAGLGLGHLIALVGELPSPQIGELRFVPGLLIGGALVLLARQGRL